MMIRLQEKQVDKKNRHDGASGIFRQKGTDSCLRSLVESVKLLLPVLLVMLLFSQHSLAEEPLNMPLPPLPPPNVPQPAESNASPQSSAEQQQAREAALQLLQSITEQQSNEESAAADNAQQPAGVNLNTGGIPNMMSAPDSSFGTIFDPAFQNIIKRQFPLTPEQIKALREVFQTIQRAKVAPIEVPTPTVSTRNVLLAPGSVPPVIKMARGYVSSIVFLDETGQPWPVANFSVGNPNSWDIQWDNSSNVLMIQGTGPYDTGNMAVRLQGLKTPVMVTMVNDQQQVDYRVDLRVQGRGPNARSSIIGGVLPGKANNVLMEILDGVSPAGSQKLTVKGGPAQAWLLNNSLYLRTSLTVLSPSWTGTMSSADGTRVYEMAATPMVLASRQGQTLELKIEGL